MAVTGEKVVVVGGSSGMGFAAARALTEAGASVIIAARSREKLDSARSALGGTTEARVLDFTNEKQVRDLFASLGVFDHLVITGAGAPAWGQFRELSAGALRSAFETKFWGYFYCAQQALPHLRRDGSLTFVTGSASRAALPGTSGLAAVNGAIAAMARTLAKELAPLRVNVISPGLVDTPAYDGMPAEAKETLFRQISASLPVGRVGRPEEIGAAVLFLVENGFTTGAVLDVDGGAAVG